MITLANAVHDVPERGVSQVMSRAGLETSLDGIIRGDGSSSSELPLGEARTVEWGIALGVAGRLVATH